MKDDTPFDSPSLYVQQFGRAMRPPPIQTRREAIIEVCTNTFLGMVGSYAITYAAFKLCSNIELASAITVGSCTVWSLVRGYVIRRRFASRYIVKYAKPLDVNSEGD